MASDLLGEQHGVVSEGAAGATKAQGGDVVDAQLAQVHRHLALQCKESTHTTIKAGHGRSEGYVAPMSHSWVSSKPVQKDLREG